MWKSKFGAIGVGFGKAVIVVAVRLVNRGWIPGWRFLVFVFLSAPLAYPLSLGPACWINQRTGVGSGFIGLMYRPFFSHILDDRAVFRDQLLWYSRVGIPNDQWPLAIDDKLHWSPEGPWYRVGP